ncbi:unnamed protein product [Adineta steineri]|uniref:Uncharacterized protein n=1 Tax=Adineta steineri TaxID=433720 RepID=A0A818YV90_9BILA|nr:unnamed protein product [Adineta steineri]CAF3755080.1 unnamed protein product [Adineta steineri]
MSKSTAGAPFNNDWKCGWFPECNAPCQSPCRNVDHPRKKCAAEKLHELKDCVHGKWGFYYSPYGAIRTWGGINKFNPSGCAVVYLLVYNRNKQQFLFDLSKKGEYTLPSHRRLTYDPEDLHVVATRILDTLLLPGNQNVPVTSIPRRFIFTDASVIYPVCLNNENASQIIFKNGRKWFDRKVVEQAMEFVALEWTLKKDNQSYGYEVKDRGAQLGHRPLFTLPTLVLRWLFNNQNIETTKTPRASSPSLSTASSSIYSSISVPISNTTSAYDSASSTLDEPVNHVSFDEFFGL